MRLAFLLALSACSVHPDQSAGQSVHEAALGLRPHRDADWVPTPGARVLYREERRAAWHLYEVRGAAVLGVLSDLAQGETHLRDSVRVDAVYPFTPAHPEVTAYLACVSEDGVTLRLAQVLARDGDVLTVMREDGRRARVPERECTVLEGSFVNPVEPQDDVAHILGLDADMPPARETEVRHDDIDIPKDARGDVGLWPNVLHDREHTYVAYCDGYLGDVKLAARGLHDERWAIETIDSRGAVGKYLSAVMGPNGPELAYLDQGRSVMRYARRVGGAWHIEDVARGKGEIGIAARLIIGPHGERDLLHYSVAYEFLLTQGVPQGDGFAWSTQTLDHAMGTYQSAIGAAFDDTGVLHVSYVDQTIGDPALRIATIPALAGPVKARAVQGVLEHVAAQSEILPGSEGRELLYLSRNDDLNLALATDGHGSEGRSGARTIAQHVRAFKAIRIASGVMAIALAVGAQDGIGGGRLELAWRAQGQWQRIVIAEHTSASFSLSEQPGRNGASVVDFAYYDDESRSLKHASAQIVAPRAVSEVTLH